MYFQTQTLELSRYMLVRDTPVSDMINIVLGFSDGSAQFATSAVYLLSMDRNSKRFAITLVSTLCKLGAKTQSKNLIYY